MASRVSRREAAHVASLMLATAREVLPLDDSCVVNLPVGQLRVCGALMGGPQPMSALGAELGVTQSAMTQIADRLERAGLARRMAGEGDRRVKRLGLTPRGQRLMAEREKQRVTRMSALLNRLSPSARKHVLHAFNLLAEVCAALRNQPRRRPARRASKAPHPRNQHS